MKSVFINGTFSLILVITFMAGMCMASERYGSLVYVQGGTTILEESENGIQVLKISDLAPYYYTSQGERSILMPVPALTGFSLPLDGAIVTTGKGGDTTSLIRITNGSLSEDTTEINLEYTPVSYYEGTALKSFEAGQKEISSETLNGSLMTGLYLEILGDIPSNDPSYSGDQCMQLEKVCYKCAKGITSEAACSSYKPLCSYFEEMCPHPTN